MALGEGGYLLLKKKTSQPGKIQVFYRWVYQVSLLTVSPYVSLRSYFYFLIKKKE